MAKSAQGMSQHLQALILQGTIDIDIKNSIFVCLKQAVDRLEITHGQVFQGPLDTLNALATDRSKFCEEQLGVNEVIGKQVVLSLVNGAACPQEFRGQPGAQKLKDLARFMRWLSTTIMPKEFDAMFEQKQKEKGRCDLRGNLLLRLGGPHPLSHPEGHLSKADWSSIPSL